MVCSWKQPHRARLLRCVSRQLRLRYRKPQAAQLSDMQSRGELDLQVSKRAQLLVQASQTYDAPRLISAQADAHKRKLRLQQVLELQRRLGHFEASKECGALASAGDQPASDARKKQRQNEAPREKGAPLIAAAHRMQ